MKTVTAVGHKSTCYQLRTDEPAPSQAIGMITPRPINTKGFFGLFIIIGNNIIRFISIGRKINIQYIIAVKTAVGQAVVLGQIHVDLHLIVIKEIGEFEVAGSTRPCHDSIKELVKVGPTTGNHPRAF